MTATEKAALADLEPVSFWAHFETLTRIARPSRHEEPVIEHVRDLAVLRRPHAGAARAGDAGPVR